MKCPNCNKEVTDDTKFCPECGHNFSHPQQETPVQQQEQSKPEKKEEKAFMVEDCNWCSLFVYTFFYA